MTKVHLAYCDQNEIPILRRCSGGASVVAMPKCLMYAVILSVQRNPQVVSIEQAHRLVLNRMTEAIQADEVDVRIDGTSDLTVNGRKFSGNSLRCKRGAVLYHGTLLYGANLDLVSNCLREPARQPEYRKQRDHRRFITNLPLDKEILVRRITDTWGAKESVNDWPKCDTLSLVDERYSKIEWNRRL